MSTTPEAKPKKPRVITTREGRIWPGSNAMPNIPSHVLAVVPV